MLVFWFGYSGDFVFVRLFVFFGGLVVGLVAMLLVWVLLGGGCGFVLMICFRSVDCGCLTVVGYLIVLLHAYSFAFVMLI